MAEQALLGLIFYLVIQMFGFLLYVSELPIMGTSSILKIQKVGSHMLYATIRFSTIYCRKHLYSLKLLNAGA